MPESNGVYNNFVAFCSLLVELVTSPIHLFSIFFGQLRHIVSQFNSQTPRFLKVLKPRHSLQLGRTAK